MAKTEFRSIKVTSDVYRLLQQGIESVRAQGWERLGSRRTDAATASSVIEEAVSRLFHQNGRKGTAR